MNNNSNQLSDPVPQPNSDLPAQVHYSGNAGGSHDTGSHIIPTHPETGSAEKTEMVLNANGSHQFQRDEVQHLYSGTPAN